MTESKRFLASVALALLVTAMSPAQNRRRLGAFLGNVRVMADQAVPTRNTNAGMRFGGAGYHPGAAIAGEMARAGLSFARIDHYVYGLSAMEPRIEGRAARLEWLDGIMKTLGQAGIREVWFCLRTDSAKLCDGAGEKLPGHPGHPLKQDPASLAIFDGIIRELAERYDGDGKGDAATAGARLAMIEINPEVGWAHGYRGDAASYLALCERVRKVVKEAAPAIQILPGAFSCGTAFNRAPKGDKAALALINANPKAKAAVAFHREIAKRHDLFDAMVVTGHGRYYSLYGEVPFYRQMIRDAGGDLRAYLAPALAASHPIPLGAYQKPPARRKAGAIVNGLRKGTSRHEAWWRAYSAGEIARKLAVASHLGIKRFAIGYMGPWVGATHLPPGDDVHVLADVLKIIEPKAPRSASLQFELEEPRLAWRAIERTMKGLVRWSRCEFIQGPPNVFAYRFTAGRRPFWICWGEDGIGQSPGREGITVEVILETPPGATCLITELAADPDGFRPTEREVQVQGKELRLTLGESPVLVEAF